MEKVLFINLKAMFLKSLGISRATTGKLELKRLIGN